MHEGHYRSTATANVEARFVDKDGMRHYSVDDFANYFSDEFARNKTGPNIGLVRSGSKS